MRSFCETQQRILATLLLVLTTLMFVAPADARGRGRGRGLHGGFSSAPYLSPYFGFRGFYGYGLYSFYGPYGGLYGPRRLAAREGGLHPSLARALELGGVDLDVRPRKAEVYVDGVFVGMAGDFDGYPQFLWLEEGEHLLTVHRGGKQTYEETVVVQPGVVQQIKFKMIDGPSAPIPSPGAS